MTQEITERLLDDALYVIRCQRGTIELLRDRIRGLEADRRHLEALNAFRTTGRTPEVAQTSTGLPVPSGAVS